MMISTTTKKFAAILLTAAFGAAPMMVWAQTADGNQATQAAPSASNTDQAGVDDAVSANTAVGASATTKTKAEADNDAHPQTKPEHEPIGETRDDAAAVPPAANGAAGSRVGTVSKQAEPTTSLQRSPEQVTAHIKSRFEEEFPGLIADSVKPTRFGGIYEIRIGADLLYSNEDVDFVLQGSLIDARNKEDITAKSLDALMTVTFDSLPLQSAIKQVKGDGSRKMVVFEDPNCGYCKQLHRTLQDMENYTVYTLLFPILSPDSTVKARNIWCAPDRPQAWRDQMLNNIAAPEGQCETPIESNLELGRELLVRGTPAIFFEDGTRVNGALPRDALEQKLDEATAAVAR